MRQQHVINIPSISFSAKQVPNLPCVDLINGSNEDYFNICVPLYQASLTGDWETAESILGSRKELVRFAITEDLETALHIAVSAENTRQMQRFVQNLVNLMETKDMELENKNGDTALCLAAAAGNVEVVEIMVNKNNVLPEIPGSQGMMPLYIAVLFGNHDMVRYLYAASRKMKGDFWTHQNRGWALLKCIDADMLDVALEIVKDWPELASTQYILDALARNPHLFDGTRRGALKLLRIIWEYTMTLPKADIDIILRGPAGRISTSGKKEYPSRVLFVAAELGNTKFVVELLRTYPDLIRKVNDDNYSIFHIAVMHRRISIYNILYEIGSMKRLITSLQDKDGNNMLHLVGKSSLKIQSQKSGASQLLQQELLWFKEVERMIPPLYRERKNKDGLTPYELFSMNNQQLVVKCLDWMKDCMVVATLIVTISFTAGFTIPGGYNQNNGIPLFVNETAFIVFVIADAISLFSSAVSVLIFLSVVTSSQRERYFLNSLPGNMMVGFSTLLISITAVMVAFCVSLFTLYHNGLKWVPILMSVFASMPMVLFVLVFYPMLVDTYLSIYNARYLFNPVNRLLYPGFNSSF